MPFTFMYFSKFPIISINHYNNKDEGFAFKMNKGIYCQYCPCLFWFCSLGALPELERGDITEGP